MSFPERYFTHNLERQSVDFVRSHLRVEWTVDKPSEDYGQDLRIGISQDGKFRGLELVLQLKSSREPSGGDDYEKIRLETSTYNYLDNLSNVVIFIKFVERDSEAYWIKLRDFPSPPQNQRTFTIRIPRDNRLSNIDWNTIVDYVDRVKTLKKNARNNVAW